MKTLIIAVSLALLSFPASANPQAAKQYCKANPAPNCIQQQIDAHSELIGLVDRNNKDDMFAAFECWKHSNMNARLVLECYKEVR